jgi:hypothetical protein
MFGIGVGVGVCGRMVEHMLLLVWYGIPAAEMLPSEDRYYGLMDGWLQAACCIREEESWRRQDGWR